MLAVAALGITSCAKQQSTEQTSTTETPPAAAPTVSDAQIAAIVVAANTADIENGKLAQTKSANADVKAFASQMVTDHTGVNEKAVALVTKLNVAPEDNDTSRNLKASQDAIRESMNGMSGAEFDVAYANNEVAYHQTVLDALDQTLIPSAQNAELKQLLIDTRPAFVAHLDHAKQLQAKVTASH
jgi:putative membrane protein